MVQKYKILRLSIQQHAKYYSSVTAAFHTIQIISYHKSQGVLQEYSTNASSKQHGGVTFVHSSNSCFLLLVFSARLEGSARALLLVPLAGVADTSFP